MAHLSHFGLENFRVFKDKTDFEFRPITILTGTNSSGKSSLTKGIRLLQQCFDIPFRDKDISGNSMITLKFNKHNHILGNFGNVVNNKSKSNIISFSLPFRWWSIPDKMTLSLSYEIDDNFNDQDGYLSELTIRLDETGEDVLHLTRISSLTEIEEDTISFEEENFEEKNSEKNKDTKKEISLMEHYEKKTNIPLLVKLLNSSVEKYQKGVNIINEFKELLELDKVRVVFDENFYNEQLSKIKISKRDKFEDLYKQWSEVKTYLSIHPEGETWIHNTTEYRNWGQSLFTKELTYYQPMLHIIEDKGFFMYYGLGESVLEIEADSSKELKSNYPILKYSFLNDKNIEYYKKDVEKIFEKEMIYFGKEWNDYVRQGVLPKSRHFDILWFLGRYNSDWISLSDDVSSEEKIYNLLNGETEYEISKEEISFGGKYDYIYKALKEGLKESFVSIFQIFKDTNIQFVPSIRNIPSRTVSRQNFTTYFEEIIEEITTQEMDENATQFLKKWIVAFEIADDLKINTIGNTGLKEILLIKDNVEMNIADVGYGYSQLLPILLTVAHYQPKYPDFAGYIKIIEEPETNLHPALQSKLADFFVECYEQFNIQFIIETHSEYLIRKLQYLIAKKKFSHKDANIYYFYPPNKVPDGEPQVKRIDFEEDGVLSDNFGSGFFDEADNLAMSLFSLDKAQKN